VTARFAGRLVIALLPLAAAALIAVLLWNVEGLENPVLYARADVGTIVLLMGAVLSLLVGAGLAVRTLAERLRAQAADARAQAAEERRRFVQRLDHELKNPLTAIRAGLANLSNDPATAVQQEALSSVGAEVLRLSRLTADLRKLAELETRPLERAPVDVAELLREAVALAEERPGAETRTLTLTLPQAPWPLPAVLGDWDLLFLGIYNLLDNAGKFTRPGDTVEVRASEEGAFVTIEVADTGPGIPQEELERVWEELYRGESSRGIPGSGLGLALVRAVAERHGGQVSLRSRVGHGTVVRMRLPTTPP
jgi:two-component system OmpR family sensor kinase